MENTITLIIPGGGVRGSFQAGFLYELVNNGIYDIDVVYASSVGSILAPLVVNKRADLLKELVTEFSCMKNNIISWPWYYFSRFLNGIIPLFFRLGLYQEQVFVDNMWKKLTDEEKLVAAKKCRVPAWNVLKKKEDWFGGDTTNVIDFFRGIKASCSLWLLVPPYFNDRNNTYYLDGCTCRLYPIEPLLSNDIHINHKIIFLDSSTRIMKEEESMPSNALNLMHMLHDTTLDIVGELQLKLMQERYKDQFCIVRPEEDILANSMDFDSLRMLKTFEMGRKKYYEVFGNVKKI